MTITSIRIDLTEDQLRAALDVIGERVSETNEHDTPLFTAERAMDSALLEHERRCPECGHMHDYEWTLCHNCAFDSAR